MTTATYDPRRKQYIYTTTTSAGATNWNDFPTTANTSYNAYQQVSLPRHVQPPQPAEPTEPSQPLSEDIDVLEQAFKKWEKNSKEKTP